MKTIITWSCVLCFCTLSAEVGISQSQQPDPNQPPDSQNICEPETEEAAPTRVIHIPGRERLASQLGKYSSEWAENYTRILTSGDEKEVIEKKEVEYLLSLHIHQQKEFAGWADLDETQKSVLEETYGILWRRLLELRQAYPAVQEAYRTTLQEDGNELSSLLYAINYSEYATWAYPEIQDGLTAVFKRTQNAAVICNCCSVMIRAWSAASDPDRERNFPGKWKPQVKAASEQCWPLFRAKLNQLTARPLTEQSAMGVILIRKAMGHKQDVEASRSPASPMEGLPQHSLSYHAVTGLYAMEQLMRKPDEGGVSKLSYWDLIHHMVQTNGPDGQTNDQSKGQALQPSDAPRE